MKFSKRTAVVWALILALLQPALATFAQAGAQDGSGAPVAPLCDAATTVSTNFNATALAAGNTVWFVSRLKVSGLGASITTIYARQASISFTANGTPYTISVPDARVIFDPAASTTTTSYDAVTGRWITRVSSGNNTKNVFASGAALTVPVGGLPGGISNVTWTATLTVDQPGVTFTWNWAAAVYTSFNASFNALGVKPVDGSSQNPYNNNDQAGTPENYKSSVTAGATGNGGSNYTGTWTANHTVTPCQAYQTGDFVWLDANRDGIQNAGEVGLADVQVNLFNEAGVILDSTRTTSSGAYSLPITPGNYYLEFVAPAGYAFTLPNQGANPALDSDANPDSGQTPVFTLGAANNLTEDAGLYQTGSLGDRIWYDTNRNGQQDSGEAGVADVGVFLYDSADSLVDVQITDTDGFYTFSGLPAGNYVIEFELLDGYAFTTPRQGGNTANDSDADPSTGRTNPITVGVGVNDLTWDAGLVRLGALGDLVWYDTNQNGIQNVGEPGLANVPLSLYRDSNNNGTLQIGQDALVATRVTSADGSFLFDALAPAVYFVDVGSLPGVYNSAAHITGPQSLADPTGPLALNDGQVYRDADFGYVVQPGSGQAIIGDTVWFDGNHNGRQEPGEPGIASLAICATPASGGAAICSQTDANGHFLLAVTAGAYRVAPPTPPPGLVATVAIGTVFNLLPGQQNLSADLGYGDPTEAALGQIGNLVFDDANFDGIFNAGDSPVAGVSVDLIRDTNENDTWDPGEPIIATVTTDSALGANNSNYQFSGIPAGRFLIHVSDTNGSLLDYSQTSLGQPDTDNQSQSDPYVVVLTPGESNVLADFGYYRRVQANTGLIGNQLWLDANNDGLYAPNSSDVGVAGVTLELWQNNAVIRTTTSGAGGVYAFRGLAAGVYQVRVADAFGVLTGYAPTQAGPNPGADHNNQVQPYAVTLAAGSSAPSADFGYRPTGVSVGGFAWIDSNGNGAFDSGEQWLNGVSLRIANSAAVTMAEVTTGPAGGFASGYYVVNNLPPGQYTVTFLAGPANYTLIGPPTRTTANLGAGQSDLTLAFPFISPTGVTVVDFTAWQQADGRIEVTWRTATGGEAPRFDVWRAPASAGEFERMTPEPLGGQADGSGYFYAWSDTSARPGIDYWYQLQQAPGGAMIGPVPLTQVTHRFFLPWAAR